MNHIAAALLLCLVVSNYCVGFSIENSGSARVKPSETVTNTDDDIIITAAGKPEIEWTPERMLSAKPKDIERFKPNNASGNPSDNSTDQPPHFRPKRQSQSDGRTWSDREIDDAAPRPFPSISKDIANRLGLKPPTNQPMVMAMRKSRPRQSVQRVDVNSAPYDAMGRLFFTDVDGNEYTCSAQYVTNDVVLTAGHCVYDVEQGHFNKDFEFVQQYNNGRGTKRSVKHSIVYRGWYSHGMNDPQFQYDFAFLAMNEPSASGSYLGIDTADNYKEWDAAGYPSNYARGRQLMSLHGYKGTVTEDVVEMLNDPMGQGCSGGAWIGNGPSGYKVVGLNSFSIDGDDSMYSPRLLADRTQKLLDSAIQQVHAK